jgi:hypothetical protein
MKRSKQFPFDSQRTSVCKSNRTWLSSLSLQNAAKSLSAFGLALIAFTQWITAFMTLLTYKTIMRFFHTFSLLVTTKNLLTFGDIAFAARFCRCITQWMASIEGLSSFSRLRQPFVFPIIAGAPSAAHASNDVIGIDAVVRKDFTLQ